MNRLYVFTHVTAGRGPSVQVSRVPQEIMSAEAQRMVTELGGNIHVYEVVMDGGIEWRYTIVVEGK